MTKRMTYMRLSSTALLTAGLFAGNMASADLEYGVRAGLSWSDNIRRAASNSRSEAVGLIDLNINADHQSRATSLSLGGNIGLRNYLRNTYNSDIIGNMVGMAEVQLVPEVLSWSFEDRFGTLQQDPFRPSTPDNRENINNFATGPNVRIALSRVMGLNLSGRYRINTFETAPLDNEVIGGSVGLVRSLSSKRSVSLNFSTDSVDYDNPLIDRDFDRRSAYVGMRSEMSRGSISVNVGVNEVDVGGRTVDGFLAGINLNRRVSARTTFTASYDQRYSAAGNIFRSFQDTGRSTDETANEISGTGDPFESQEFRAGLNYERDNNTWVVGTSYSDDDYVSETGFDRTRLSIFGGLTRPMGSGWRSRFDARLSRGDFGSISRDDLDMTLTAGLSRRLSRFIDVEVAYQLRQRNSDVRSAEYVENRVTLTVGYTKD